jgi:Zn-finger nucleic acid-binding protein
VELDGCEQCHGIWVENGELRKVFEELHARERADDEARRQLAIAQYAIESQQQVERANWLASLFSLLRKRVPPFSGFG